MPTINKEIRGEQYNVSYTVTENAVTIQAVSLQAIGRERNLLPVMDKQILRELHEELVHKHLNHAV